MSKMKRNNFIDIAKGVAIFLMLWGHCIQICVIGSGIDFFENSVFKTIYSFHMPLFMLISGYLFYFSFLKRDLKELLIHRTQALLQPIVFCTIFDFFATTVLLGLLSGRFNSPFDGAWMQNLSHLLWFLWSVLAASIAVAIVCKKCK
ncbi:MAG: acyltransferase family protein, partial [Clostridia bacterium]|nr:acyltransferase family protein [Clostridia bacterium]